MLGPSSHLPPRGLLAAVLMLAAACAQSATPAPPPAAAASAPAQPAPARKLPDAAGERHVDEDDAVRIEELRIAGQTERLVVKPKWPGAREYEIVPPVRGRDMSQPRGNVGQRVWSVLSF